MMKCFNCNYEIKENWNCCPNCGKEFIIDSNNQLQKNEKYIHSKSEKYLIFLFVVFMLTPLLISEILFSLSSVSSLESYKDYLKVIESFDWIFILAALITIIYGKIKYPKNKIIKTIFNIFVTLILIYVVWVMLFMLTCFVAIG